MLFPVVREFQEQKSIKQESRSRKNTSKHAKYDLKNAKGALKRAESETNSEDPERYNMNSFRNSVDSAEKNGKVLTEMIGIEKTKVGKREIRQLHSNVDINNALKNNGIDFVDNEMRNVHCKLPKKPVPFLSVHIQNQDIFLHINNL